MTTLQLVSDKSSPAAPPRAGLIGVVVFSDQRLVAEGLQALMRAAGGFAVPAVTGAVAHLVEAVRRLQPAAVLLDVGAGGPKGAAAVAALAAMRPQTKVVVLADTISPALVQLIAAGGADALLAKSDATGRATVHAVRDVIAGRRVLSGAWNPSPRATPASDLERLSARQREVLRLVVAGYSNAEIARELVITVNTVKFHVRTIFRELNVRSRVDAARRFGRLAVGLTAPAAGMGG